MLPVGGCTETPVNAETKRIDGANLPWAYVVVNEARIECQDTRVLVHAVPGLEIILASIGDDATGSYITRDGPAILHAVEVDFKRVAPDAVLSQEHDVTFHDATFGEEHRTGRCGRVDFTREGQPFVSHVCAAWATTAHNAQSHLVTVLFTNTEADNIASHVDVPDLMQKFVLAHVINPAPVASK